VGKLPSKYCWLIFATRSSLSTVQERRKAKQYANPQAKFIRMKSTYKKRTPNTENLPVKRRYLTGREVERLMNCARKHGRYGHRDATMILVAYRHGLRAGAHTIQPSSFEIRCTVPVPMPSDLATFKIPTPFASCFRTFRSVALSIFGRPSFTP